MPRVHLNQTNFTAGEIAPDMYGRTDIDRYPNAVKRLRNCFSKPQGGAVGREGSIFVASAKYPDRDARLIPFVFNRTQSYMLEFGDNYMRVFRNGAPVETSPGVPYELVTQYDQFEIREMDFAQRRDTMFIFHPNSRPRRLRRFGHASWDMAVAPWVYEPTAEQGFEPSADLTLSAASVGTGRTATASVASFLQADVGREITSAAGLAVITSYTSTTVVTVEILVAFSGTAIASGAWKIEGTPQTVCTASAATPIGKSITLTLTDAGWRSVDDGKLVSINGGLVEITTYTSPTVVSGKILRELSSATGAEALAWTLESSMWGGDNGYPATGCFHQQRLIMGGSTGYPSHIFGSVIGNTLDFLMGDDDSAAFATPLSDSDEIRFLSSVKALSSLSYNGEFVIEGGVEKPITPTNQQITNQSNYGTDLVRPVRIGNELYFVQRSGQKLRAFTYRFTEDNFDAPDMTKLASHIAGPGIVELSHQQEPYGRLFCRRADGIIAEVTLDRSEGVVAWAPWDTQGEYVSVATIPAGDRDQTWIITKRVVGGVEQRYIEYFDPNVHTDCCVVAESVSPETVWGNLGHLEGLEVSILADDVVMPPMVVTGGQVTLPREANKTEIGLSFLPYIELLPVEFPTGNGTAQGAQGKVGEIVVRLLETVGCAIGNPSKPEEAEVVPFRQFGLGILDQAVPPFTGDKKINKLGWDQTTGSIFISQPQPLPFHVLSVVRRVTVND